MIINRKDAAYLDGLLKSELQEKTGRTSREEQDLDFVWKEDGKVLGGICARKVFSTCFVDLLAVEKQARGKGIGRKLMDHLEEACLKLGVRSIVLTTQDYQAPDFYRKLGYVETGRLEDIPFAGTVRFQFRKDL